jgi:prefoldin subunit 5
MLEAVNVLQDRINNVRTYLEKLEQEAGYYEKIAQECREKAQTYASDIQSLESAIVKLGSSVEDAAPPSRELE